MAENQRGNQYSIYQQKDVEGTFVDWGQIASDLTTGLEAISANREAQRQKIADDTTAAMNTLSEIADVNNPSMNTALIDASDLSTKSLQANYDLVRRGLLDIKDFNVMMQRQKDGYASLSNFAKNYDAKYQEALTRIANGEASALEEFWKDTSHKFGNMKNKKIWTNPANGELMLVEMIPDPNDASKLIMPDANNPDHKKFFHTPSQMLKISDYQEQKIDTGKYVTENIVSPLASVIKEEMESYTVRYGGAESTKIKNFRQLFELTDIGGGVTYDKWLEDQVVELVGAKNEDGSSSSFRAAQVLASKGYTFTQDPTKAGGKVILTVSDENGSPSVQLTKEQFADAERLAQLEVETQLDLEITKSKPLPGKNDPVADREDRDRIEKEDKRFGYIKQINSMLTGDVQTAQNEANNMIDQFNSTLSTEEMQTKGIRGIVVTNDSIRIVRNDGSEYEVQRFTTDEEGGRIDTKISKDTANIFNQIVPGLGDDVVSEEEIIDIINKKDYKFGDRRAEEDILNFRRGQSELSYGKLVNTQASEVLGGKDPLEYLIDDFGDDTGFDDMTDEIGPSIRNVLKSMLPTDLIKLNNDMGYQDPFTSFKIVDTAGTDTVEFEFGGQKLKIDFGTDRTPQYVMRKIEETIQKGIDNMNEKRTKTTFKTQLNYKDWVNDKDANPSGSQSMADYLKWLQSN